MYLSYLKHYYHARCGVTIEKSTLSFISSCVDFYDICFIVKHFVLFSSFTFVFDKVYVLDNLSIHCQLLVVVKLSKQNLRFGGLEHRI